ncbi:MAG: GDP-mannose 4,6-dehydratase, partial [Bacteroidetes bacterium]|nr:GDP-mannose 4,6-dehydratase [Bacteroidota bacterium]
LEGITVKQDPERMRPSDTPYMLGDNSTAVKKLGWKPEITLDKTLKDLLNYYRSIV